MSDVITAKGSDSKFQPHPEGQFVGQCVDTIDLGENVEQFVGQPPKLAHKCVIVFRTGERNEQTGDYIDVAREFTVSMNDRANLRKFLEQWRGKAYTTEQIEQGVPLHKLTGNPALLTIAHKVSGGGRTYANITAIVGVPKQMQNVVIKYDDYKREQWWDDKKKTYAEAVRKFKHDAGGPQNGDEFDGFTDDEQPTDDLPF